MSFGKAGLISAISGALCLAVAWMSNSGLGSCGPYGPVGWLAVLGPILLLLGAALSLLHAIVRGMKLYQSRRSRQDS